MLQHTCYSKHATSFMLQQTCYSKHATTYMLQHTWNNIHATTFMKQHTVYNIIKDTTTLRIQQHICYNIHATTYMLQHTWYMIHQHSICYIKVLHVIIKPQEYKSEEMAKRIKLFLSIISFVITNIFRWTLTPFRLILYLVISNFTQTVSCHFSTFSEEVGQIHCAHYYTQNYISLHMVAPHC